MGLLLSKQVYPLGFPFLISKDEKFKSYPIFKGITAGLKEISSHSSVLTSGNSEHLPHSHKEEEFVILLSGSLDLIVPDGSSADIIKSVLIEKGQFIYYPSYFTHTIQGAGMENANYLVIKWHAELKNNSSNLTFGRFNMFDRTEHPDFKDGLESKLLFEGPTSYLHKLRSHICVLQPGAGRKPHSDSYDAVIIVLEGELETIGQNAKPFDVIFYSAGNSYGLYNPGTIPNRYLVFEFHTQKMKTGEIAHIIEYFFARITDKGFWKRKLKKILNVLPANLKR
ncbi:MAG: cupin domain-containing protein [Candidatus Humimicrobiaceae bacterium]